MEVHPPDHPILSWRDFFVHIATITIGLLIAIGLEQSVEWFHHRHLLHTAREQLTEELRENRRIVAADKQHLESVSADLRQNLILLDAKGPSVHAPGKIKLSWHWEAPRSSGWQTAQQTGAITLMSYEEVQSLALVYGQQAIVQDEALRHIHSITSSLVPMLRHGGPKTFSLDMLSAAERIDLANSIAQNLTETNILGSLLAGLDQDYSELEKRGP